MTKIRYAAAAVAVIAGLVIAGYRSEQKWDGIS